MFLNLGVGGQVRGHRIRVLGNWKCAVEGGLLKWYEDDVNPANKSRWALASWVRTDRKD